jgi:hypothetical protein
MPYLANSSGYTELIFILAIILLQLIGSLLNKANENKKKQNAPAPRREFKPVPHSQPAPKAVPQSVPEDEKDADVGEEIRKLLEALGNEFSEVENKPAATVAKKSDSQPQPMSSSSEKKVPATEKAAEVLPKVSSPAPPNPDIAIKAAVENIIKDLPSRAPVASASTGGIQEKATAAGIGNLRVLLRDPNEARRGIILAEVLGKPLGLR